MPRRPPRPDEEYRQPYLPSPGLSTRNSVRSQHAHHSLSRSQSKSTNTDAWPVHPIPALRGPFDESIAEAMDPDVRIRRTLDAAARRLQLLELDDFPEDFSSRWRAKPGAKFHPLWKLIAQISFGIHLLHQHTAKSEEEVIRILQIHIDEVDGFLEDTHADFDLAVRDINERARLLQLSLDHGRTFGRMLRDADFRASTLHGNDVIERIVSRTSKALKDSMEDVRKGVDATAEFAKYLDRVKLEWTLRNEDMGGVFEAMRGNAEGWYICFNEIDEKAKKLKGLMAWLSALVSEVARRAGIASRKVLRERQFQLRSSQSVASRMQGAPSRSGSQSTTNLPSRHLEQPLSPTMSTKSNKSKRSMRLSMSKPLPPDPTRPRIPPIEKPPYQSDITIQQFAPEHHGISRSMSAVHSTGHSRRPSKSDDQHMNLRQGENARSPQQQRAELPQRTPSAFSPSHTSPLTPSKLLQLLEMQQGSVHPETARAIQSSPLDTPLTPGKLLEALEEAKVKNDDGQAHGGLYPSPFGSPLTPGQLLQILHDANGQTSPQRNEGAGVNRPLASPPPAEMKIPVTQMAADIHVNLDDIAEEGLHSPLPSQMLIPVIPDMRESLHLNDMFLGRPPPSSTRDRKGSVGSMATTGDVEEKQVMSRETFLMLDDVEEEGGNKRPSTMGGIAELDDRKRSMHASRMHSAVTSDKPQLPEWASLTLTMPAEHHDVAELDVRKTMNGMDLSKLENVDEETTLSRKSTTKSKSSGGTRSRPHSSYSVVEAYRKSRQITTGVEEAEMQPPVPSVPTNVHLAHEATPAAAQSSDVQRSISTDSNVPQLTQSVSTTSVSSGPNQKPVEMVTAPKPTPQNSQLRLEPYDETKEGERPQSPTGPAIIDDGLLELIRPSARPSPIEPTSLGRSKSIHPLVRSPVTDEQPDNTWKLSGLFRSNSSKSHRRASKFSLPSAYSKQTSPTLISPNSIMASIGSKAVSPAFTQTSAMVSPASTWAPAASPMMPPRSAPLPPVTPSSAPPTSLPPPPPVPPLSAQPPAVPQPPTAPPPPAPEPSLAVQTEAIPPAGPSLNKSISPSIKHDSWMSEKVVVMRPPSAESAVERKDMVPAQASERKPSKVITRKPAPSPLVMPPTTLVEADDGTPRAQRMMSTFTPLSPQPHPALSPRKVSYGLMPPPMPSPSALSSVSKEALPQLNPTTPGSKPKKFGTLRRPVNAVRGLFRKQTAQQAQS